ncbi:MAG: hypothetical protein BGN88_03340 [Clostridiales bacterium 43-6]|nr:MAG: hypothetical protein BGN88_03340 [Clostridiales bacterium 43-6]
MFDRVSIKIFAKQRFEETMGLSVLVCFVAGLLGANGYLWNNSRSNFTKEWFPENYLISVLMLFIVLISIVQVLVGPAAELGLNHYSLKVLYGEPVPFGLLFSRFEIFLKALGLRLFMTLFIFLWTLLLIIPGIIAGIKYSMAPFIMADDPNVGIREAMNISKAMTDGYKTELFVMSLSFLGWSILCLLTLGIGYLWLTPYKKLSFTNTYLHLRNFYFHKFYPQQPSAY